MRKFLLKIAALLLLPAILTVVTMGYNRNSKGFTDYKISSPLTYHEKWDILPLSEVKQEELSNIFSQKFIYLSMGIQCYAFISEDGQYVIKFFKMSRLLPKTWLNYIPLPFLDNYRFEKVYLREQNLYDIFAAYRLAYEKLKDETGLVYVHLNKSKDLKRTLTLLDQKGKKHRIDLDKTEFLLQKKAEPFYPTIANLLKNEGKPAAREAISSFLRLVATRCKKGLADKDLGVSSNYGFIDRKAVQIDFGGIIRDEYLKEPANLHKEILRVARKLETWMEKSAPELIPDLHEELDLLFD